MIIARVFGGLGNQLFIYAMARRLSLKNKCPLKLDVKSGFKWDTMFKREYLLNKFNICAQEASSKESFLNFGGRARRFLVKRANEFLPIAHRNYICDKHGGFNHEMLNLQIGKAVYLEGYWQSEKYFKDAEDVIREDLKINASFGPDACSEAELIRNTTNAVCVGIRRFEEGKGSYSNILGMEYYLRAVEEMASRVSDVHFFVATEDVKWAKQNFNINHPCTFISHKEGNTRAHENLWLMSLCKHFIISQSTYQWWGAWLSENPDKIIFVPDNSIAGVSKDFFPDEWIKISV